EAYSRSGESYSLRHAVGAKLPTTHATTGVSRIRRIEFDRKSSVDRASRNEIAKFPIREFTRRKHSPHGVIGLGYRNARPFGVVDQVSDNRLANLR
ncbi:hypothetical protein, partial [Mesorhizobium sp. SARCC-RB16n]|uniref:hypothetical protein n=1 Tax=Mesorhizobium sp. SARCC-RB16n TaxID=2116687 RepID=UPI001AEEB076